MTCKEAYPLLVEYRQRFLVEPQPKWPTYYTKERTNAIYAINTVERQFKLCPDEDVHKVLYRVICLFFEMELAFDDENKPLVLTYEQCQEECEAFEKFIFNRRKLLYEFSEYNKECRKLDIKAQS